jgi:hypothetical protein
MTKKELIKFISGKAAITEQNAVVKWINQSEENLKYFISLKNLWVLQNMPETKASESEMAAAERIMSEAESEKKKKNNFRRFLPYAAAVITGLLVFNIYLHFKQLSDSQKELLKESITLAMLPAEAKHTLYTPNGVRGYVVLPDSSHVWLNSASKITYPNRFIGPTREVEISGEAYFDVKSDPANPMIISTNRDFKIHVVGTKFTVRSYPDDNEAQTTLIDGSIKLVRTSPVTGEDIITNMKPSESFLIKDNDAPILIRQADTSKQTAWKEGKLIFDSTPMPEVIKKLERWHGTKFTVKDPDILKFKFTANFRSESIVQIMEMLKFASLIDYSVEENHVTLFKQRQFSGDTIQKR